VAFFGGGLAGLNAGSAVPPKHNSPKMSSKAMKMETVRMTGL